MSYKTEQENFWATSFGDEYIERNKVEENYAQRVHLFSQILSQTYGIKSICEFGANIGNNLHALHSLLPDAEIQAIEINKKACDRLSELGWLNKVYNQSILETSLPNVCDLSFCSGVLIHINPDELEKAYQAIYDASKRYVMVCEYYNPSPVSISYRGHSERLFKRDFAGEMLDMFPDLKLLKYGFAYHRDPNFPMDDLTWFLMEKQSS